MAADGDDFSRRKPLYGKAYYLSKEGKSPEEIVPALVKGFRKECVQRPLHAFPDLTRALVKLDAEMKEPSSLFSGDTEHMANVANDAFDRICCRHLHHDSTRHLREAAEHLKEQIIQGCLGNQSSLSEQQAGELLLGEHFHRISAEPLRDYHAYFSKESSVDAARAFEAIQRNGARQIGELVDLFLNSPSGRRPKGEAAAFDHSTEALMSHSLES